MFMDEALTTLAGIRSVQVLAYIYILIYIYIYI